MNFLFLRTSFAVQTQNVYYATHIHWYEVDVYDESHEIGLFTCLNTHTV